MYRGSFAPPPAQSPPLHHPVPQHVSTVPMMRSPPPPAPQQPPSAGYGGNPYQPSPAHGGSGSYAPGAPAFGGFMNEPTAQMGFQVGKSAMAAGQEYMENNFNRYVSIPALKHYFNVSNSYVLNKLILVLFPGDTNPGPDSKPGWLQPRSKWSNPAATILVHVPASSRRPELAGYVYSRHGSGHIYSAVSVTGWIPGASGVDYHHGHCCDRLRDSMLKLATYILNINNDSQLLDLVAYSGYKFVGIIVTMVTSEIFNPGQGTRGWVGWTVFAYTFLANAFFLLRSLKYVLLPDSTDSAMHAGSMQAVARSQRNRRGQFLFVYSYAVQFIFMWVLSREGPSSAASAGSASS
ncbi:Hrf1 [Penicillium expansum]|nr:Hrf1 [Penicillium expansum]